ncbi:MAG: hypothetical protein JWN76_1216, partial [Chitinophagaceae bacterium]|nr:hypothetical protein [Chitinophagaceae bacterium]
VCSSDLIMRRKTIRPNKERIQMILVDTNRPTIVPDDFQLFIQENLDKNYSAF